MPKKPRSEGSSEAGESTISYVLRRITAQLSGARREIGIASTHMYKFVAFATWMHRAFDVQNRNMPMRLHRRDLSQFMRKEEVFKRDRLCNDLIGGARIGHSLALGVQR